MGTWLPALPPGADLVDIPRGGGPIGEGPAAAALLEMIRSLPDMPGTLSRGNAGSLQFHFSPAPGQEIPRDLQALMGLRPGSRYEPGSRRDGGEPANAVFFPPQTTNARWKEEAQILFGGEYTIIAALLRVCLFDPKFMSHSGC